MVNAGQNRLLVESLHVRRASCSKRVLPRRAQSISPHVCDQTSTRMWVGGVASPLSLRPGPRDGTKVCIEQLRVELSSPFGMAKSQLMEETVRRTAWLDPAVSPIRRRAVPRLLIIFLLALASWVVFAAIIWLLWRLILG